MGVRLDAIPVEIVCVLVVRVMLVGVAVNDCIMGVLVFVMFAQMQPDTNRHECRSNAKLHRDRVTEEQHRQNSAKERRDRKIGASPRGAKVSQREDKQHEAQPITEEPDRRAVRN